MRDKSSARDAAERDVALSNALMRVHPRCIFVIDAIGVKLTRHLFTFAKRCVDAQMQRPDYIHVVNCPKWAKTIHKFVKRLVKGEEEDIVTLHTASYADIEHIMHAIYAELVP